MPYIESKIDRTDLIIGERSSENAGELNFFISSVVHLYIKEKGLCYQTLNEVIGVLECCKQELYHTVIGPYEDKKRLENGSVSELDDNSQERMR